MTRPAVKVLAKDFKRWGRTPTQRVLAGVKKWGTQFGCYVRETDC